MGTKPYRRSRPANASLQTLNSLRTSAITGEAADTVDVDATDRAEGEYSEWEEI